MTENATIANEQRIMYVLEVLIDFHPVGIKHREAFYQLDGLHFNEHKLYYITSSGVSKSVCSKIKKLTDLQTEKWLDHLYFINQGKQIKYKTYIEEKWDKRMCNRCSRFKDTGEFQNGRNKYVCKQCNKEYMREYRTKRKTKENQRFTEIVSIRCDPIKN